MEILHTKKYLPLLQRYTKIELANTTTTTLVPTITMLRKRMLFGTLHGAY